MADTNYFETFTFLTGVTSRDVIQRWLEIGNFDVERAVQMFYASQEGQGAGIPNPPMGNIPISPLRGPHPQHLMTKALDPDVLATFRQFYDSDEEMHRALQQQSTSANQFDADGIRRADEIIRGSQLISVDDRRAAYERDRHRMRATAFTSGNTFQPKTEKEKTLSTLFQPPHDIMTIGDLEAAKELAVTQNCWLLVNLQRDSEFACHVLNRDLWNEESVKDMMLCSFIFWQQLDESMDGRKFMERYKVVEFPHVSILDPRTGALVWRRDGDRVTPTRLKDELPDFLSRNAEPDDADIGKLSSAARTKELLRLATTSTNKRRGFEDTAGGVPESSSSSRQKKQSDQDDEDDNNDEDYHYLQREAKETKRQRSEDSSHSFEHDDPDYEQAVALSLADTTAAAQQAAAASSEDQEQPGFLASSLLTLLLPMLPDSDDNINRSISLRIKVADGQQAPFVLKLNTLDSAWQLLREVAKQLQERRTVEERRFELNFGHPVIRLQSLEELFGKRLSEVGIDQNMVINLRFL